MDSFAFFFSPLGREASGAEFGLSSEREGERRHEDLWPELRRVSRIFLASLALLERGGKGRGCLVWTCMDRWVSVSVCSLAVLAYLLKI